MPFVSRDLLRLSLEALNQSYSPLLIISLPCMLANKVPVCDSAKDAHRNALPFGVRQEREWLETHFALRGHPPGKPFFMPGTGAWVEERYPDRALQRRRKDFEGTIFYHPDKARWAFFRNAGSQIRKRVLDKKPQVPLVALMAWMWRKREIRNLDEATREFAQDIGFKNAGLLGNVYTTDVPAHFRDVSLTDAALNESEVAELVGATTPAPEAPPLDSAVAQIEAALASQHVVLTPGLIERIVGGWLVGDIVVLVGTTGTGKTFLSRTLANALKQVFGDRFFSVMLEVSPDYDIGQFLGYENLAGEFTAGRFANDVLFVGEASDPRLVVLDEWNLAQIDAYFAPILSSIETHLPLRIPGRVNLTAMSEDERDQLTRAQPSIADGQWTLPENTFFLATCNSWTDEPETRLPISGPVKRRCRIMTMPNVLELAFQQSESAGIVNACNTILSQERGAVEERANSGIGNVWDKHRRDRLAAIPTLDALGDASKKLIQISRALLQNPQTKGTFTLGILRDILLSAVYAQPGGEFASLGQQVADKVLHQVNGDPKILEALTEISKEFPNAKEINDLARRMGAFSGERRIRPLV
jgi:hypothetical protein